MRLGRTARLLGALVLALTCAAPAQAYEFNPSWGYAFIDDHPFNDPEAGGALLPTTRVFPRGTIRDKRPPDDHDVRITVHVFTPGKANAEYSYRVSEGDFVDVSFDRRIDIQPLEVSYLRYDFCRFIPSSGPDKDCDFLRIGRPPPEAPPPGGGPPPPPPPVDRDGDGVPPPADCWDTNATVWPGGVEIPGNGIDDDCAGGDQPGRVTATVKHHWAVFRKGVRVTQMRVRGAPAAAKVEVRCHGRRCPFRLRKAAVKANGSTGLRRFFSGRLRRGVTIEVRVIAPNSIGKVVRFRIRRGKLPVSRTLCLPPGARKPQRC